MKNVGCSLLVIVLFTNFSYSQKTFKKSTANKDSVTYVKPHVLLSFSKTSITEMADSIAITATQSDITTRQTTIYFNIYGTAIIDSDYNMSFDQNKLKLNNDNRNLKKSSVINKSFFYNDLLNNLYFSDRANHKIQKITLNDSIQEFGVLEIEDNQLTYPSKLFTDIEGNTYFSDSSNYKITKLKLAPQIIIKTGEKTGMFYIIKKKDTFDIEGDKTIIIKPKVITNAELSPIEATTITLKNTQTAQPIINEGQQKVVDKEQDSILPENDTYKEKKIYYHFNPSIGLTYNNSKTEGVKSTDLQWLASLNADFDYIGSKFNLSGTLFMQYGESKTKGQPAEKLQDAFILSLTPSIPLFKKPAIRLFLETTIETELGRDTIGGSPTSFLDPWFLYQTLFLGQKHYSFDNQKRTTWELTYGLGYAYQQSFDKNFVPQNNTNGNSGFETGFSGVFEFNMNSKISEAVNFVFNSKAVALSRANLFKDFNNSRQSVLISSGIYYKMIGLDYNYHWIHDLNISNKNMFDQSILLTISF